MLSPLLVFLEALLYLPSLVDGVPPLPAPVGVVPWFRCPSRSHIRPCVCQERPKGLDVSCEGGTLSLLREPLSVVSQLGQTVWFLKARNVPVESLENSFFQGMDIRHVTVSYANVSSLEEMTFSGLGDRMESLDLSQNSLTQVPSKALRSLRVLVALNLNYNRIEILQAGAFKGLISLLRLSLLGNRVKFIDDLAFVGIGGNLTRMNLGGNQLTSVPSQALKNLTVLQTLQLHENQIYAVLPEEFRGMGDSLDVLNLARNMLQELPARTFGALRALNSLDLEGNLIDSIDWAVFWGIEGSLEWLKLGNNQLMAVPTLALRNLTKLRQLDLRSNNISYVGEDAFYPFGVNIKYLYLQKNSIESLEPGSLDNLHAVEWLYLHSNKLGTIQYETLMNVLDTIQVLDLHDNPFHCDCRISWFRDWINDQQQSVVNMPKETRCSSPQPLVNHPISDLASGQLVCASARNPQSGVLLLAVSITAIYIASRIRGYKFRRL